MAVQPTELSLQCHRLSLSRLLPECPVFRAFEVVASNWNSNNFLPFGDRMNSLIRQDSVTVCNTNRSVLSGRQFSSDTYRRIGQDLRTKALVSRNDGQECTNNTTGTRRTSMSMDISKYRCASQRRPYLKSCQ